MAGPIRIGVAGALGRMGGAIARVLEGRPEATVVLGFDKPGTEGRAWGASVLGRSQDAATCDVLIDFTTPSASVALARRRPRTRRRRW
jgi:4-hydroxy-tetrahydrodipicolinate reductase